MNLADLKDEKVFYVAPGYSQGSLTIKIMEILKDQVLDTSQIRDKLGFGNEKSINSTLGLMRKKGNIIGIYVPNKKNIHFVTNENAEKLKIIYTDKDIMEKENDA